MHTITQIRHVGFLALVSTLVLIAGPWGAPAAAETDDQVRLARIDTPEVGVGRTLKLAVCVPAARIDDVRTWQLALAGLPIAQDPGAELRGACHLGKNGGEASGAAASSPSPRSGSGEGSSPGSPAPANVISLTGSTPEAQGSGGQLVDLTYLLDYKSDGRAQWIRIFRSRDRNNTVGLGLVSANESPILLSSESVSPEVTLRKYPRHWWIPLIIVGGLLAWLVSWRETNILRDSTLSVVRYFRSQMEEFREARRTEIVNRRELIAEMMTKGVPTPIADINDVLKQEGDEQVRASEKLASLLESKQIKDAAGKLEKIYTSCNDNKRWAKRLQADLAKVLGRAVSDPYDNADKFTEEMRQVQITKYPPPYSLGRMQMAWWFLIVVGGVALMYVATGTLFAIPESVLWLIGISTGTAGLSFAIDRRQPSKMLPPKSKSKNPLDDILTDSQGGDTFYRWQMLVSTVLLGLVFIVELVRNFVMTDFDETMLVLIGISSGTYLGFKWPERSPQEPSPTAGTP